MIGRKSADPRKGCSGKARCRDPSTVSTLAFIKNKEESR
jgi:hypothetical protein